jgi:acyl carrier protein
MNEGKSGSPGGEGMDVLETVKAYVVENFLYGDDSRVDADTPFLEGGIIDSTGVLELVGFLEERFGIRVEDDELVPDNLNSLHKITLYISRKIGNIQPA